MEFALIDFFSDMKFNFAVKNTENKFDCKKLKINATSFQKNKNPKTIAQQHLF